MALIRANEYWMSFVSVVASIYLVAMAPTLFENCIKNISMSER